MFSEEDEGVYSATLPKKRVANPRFITGPEYGRAKRGMEAANLRGIVLNSMVTVNWDTLNIGTDVDVEAAHTSFKELFGHWLHERFKPSAFIWVVERGADLGLHTHFLAHVGWMYRHALLAYVEEAVETAAGRRPVVAPKGSIRTVDVKPAHDDDIEFQVRSFRYLMKGLDPQAMYSWRGGKGKREFVSVEDAIRLEAQGEIHFKRIGTNRFLSSASADRIAKEYGGWATIDTECRPFTEDHLHYPARAALLRSLDI